MRCLSLAILFALGAVCLVPETSDAGIIFRRRGRDCCCDNGYGYRGYGYAAGCGCGYAAPVVAACGCGSYGYAGGYAGPLYASGAYAGPAYGTPVYPGAPGYAPGAGYESGYAAPGIGQPMPSPGPAVAIRDGAFEPKTINVRVGDTVQWTNNGQKVHTVTAADGSFDSGDLAPGKTFSHKFDKAGAFEYHCRPHKDVMTGSIIVAEKTGIGAPPPGSEPLPKTNGR